MTKIEFQELVHKNIPITEKMGITIDSFELDKIVIKAEIEANINDKSTAFGGSISALATIGGWIAAKKHMDVIAKTPDIVVYKSNIRYIKPIKKDFIAEIKCDLNKFEKFKKNYLKKGKAKIEIDVEIKSENEICAVYTGAYAAIN